MNNEFEESDRLSSSIRTYAAKEAVRLARERVRRNDMIVTQLMQRSALTEFESGPTEEMIHAAPGELSRPGFGKNSRVEANDQDDYSNEVKDIENEVDTYRIKTSSTLLSFFRDLFD